MTTLFLSACQSGSSDQAAAKVTVERAAKEPFPPAASADDNVWGEYLAAKGRIHAADVQQRPYSYIIPAGDSQAAISRRKEETESIASSIGHILIPGSLLIVGGPNADEVTRFAAELPKSIKDHEMEGITVLVIGDAKEKDMLTKAFERTGATLKVSSM